MDFLMQTKINIIKILISTLIFLVLSGCISSLNNQEMVTMRDINQPSEQLIKNCPTFENQSVNCNPTTQVLEIRRNSKGTIEKISEAEMAEIEE